MGSARLGRFDQSRRSRPCTLWSCTFFLVPVLHALTVSIQLSGTQVEELDGKNIAKVACGQNFSLALSSDGMHLYAFGRAIDGELGIGYSQDGSAFELVHTPRPVRLPMAPLATIVAGSRHALAVTTTHEVYTWGCNDSHCLGHKVEGLRVFVPRLLDLSRFASQGGLCHVYNASAGSNHTLLLFKEVPASLGSHHSTASHAMSTIDFLRAPSPRHLLNNEPQRAVLAALGDDVTGVNPWAQAAALQCQHCTLFLVNGICPLNCIASNASIQPSVANNADATVHGLAIRSAGASGAEAIDTEDTSGMELDESGSASGGAAMDGHASAGAQDDDSGTERHENVELPRSKKRRLQY
jgi:Regulator of chromosome condensation (RCC1) repeat